MHTVPNASLALAEAISHKVKKSSGIKCVVCPPFISIIGVADTLRNSSISVGAQNLHWESEGAFTGEIAAEMLKGIVEFAIVGHSERRALFGETDSQVSKKAKAAAANGITPILCVGESAEERRSRKAVGFVRTQIIKSLQGFVDWGNLAIAYEPVWAIGSGRSATPMQAEEMAVVIRDAIRTEAGTAADEIPILYGGSVTSVTTGPFLDRPNIDGLLVGGSSLNADEFSRIVEVAQTVRSTSL